MEEKSVESVESPRDVGPLLERWRGGDRQAAGELMQLCYAELHRIAGAYFLRERADHTLQATAVVHEAYLAILGQEGARWHSRAHFIGFMARVMRRVLIEHARRRHSLRRGGRARKLTLAESSLLATAVPPDVVALDDALRDLGALDQRKAELVELRFFGGLTLDESAEVLGISRATAVREWRRARAWLYRALTLETAIES